MLFQVAYGFGAVDVAEGVTSALYLGLGLRWRVMNLERGGVELDEPRPGGGEILPPSEIRHSVERGEDGACCCASDSSLIVFSPSEMVRRG
jgi:hypothetical protein